MTSNSDLQANKAFKKSNKGFYKYYNKGGHIESKCFIKYPELNNNSNSNSTSSSKSYFNKNKNKNKNKDKNTKDSNKKTESSKAIISAYIANNRNIENRLVLDSSATEHYTPNKDWLIDYKIVYNRYITIANSAKVKIEGIGNIPTIIGNKNVLIKDVSYIPSLKATLISSKELTNKGWSILFKDNIAELSNKKYNLSLKAI